MKLLENDITSQYFCSETSNGVAEKQEKKGK